MSGRKRKVSTADRKARSASSTDNSDDDNSSSGSSSSGESGSGSSSSSDGEGSGSSSGSSSSGSSSSSSSSSEDSEEESVAKSKARKSAPSKKAANAAPRSPKARAQSGPLKDKAARKGQAAPSSPGVARKKEVQKDIHSSTDNSTSPPKKKAGRPPRNPTAKTPAAITSPKKSPVSKTKRPLQRSRSFASTDRESGSESDRPQKKKIKIKTQKEDAASSESEVNEKQPASPPSKKVTRSSSVRKSKFVVGPDSEEESDTGGFGGKAPRKKGSVVVGKRSTTTPSASMTPRANDNGRAEVEERKCPVRGCDSLGHLSGKYDRHFTYLSCPTYHHRRKEECVAMMKDRVEMEKKRAQLLSAHRASGNSGGQSAEQKAYLQKVTELRKKTSRKRETSPGEAGHRQLDLSGITSEYDLKIFEEAQAAASEALDKEFQGRPCTGEGISYIQMGRYEMQTWYQSPYPEDIACLPKVYICEFCLKYMKSATTMRRHGSKCDSLYPPGREIYRKDKLNVWEIDGAQQKTYCQNLCLLAKLFLDHKTLYYDVEPFLFYVLCSIEPDGCHIIGYFSKEKNSFLNYNVSCILTLPSYQRQGFGRLLIDFSYLLTITEGKTGSPEKPLSDLGIITYRNYWKSVILKYLCKFEDDEKSLFSIKSICTDTGIAQADIVSTLQALGMLKYWRGRHLILKQHDLLEKYREKMKKRAAEFKELERKCLKWTPYRSSTGENGQKNRTN